MKKYHDCLVREGRTVLLFPIYPPYTKTIFFNSKFVMEVAVLLGCRKPIYAKAFHHNSIISSDSRKQLLVNLWLWRLVHVFLESFKSYFVMEVTPLFWHSNLEQILQSNADLDIIGHHYNQWKPTTRIGWLIWKQNTQNEPV